MRLFVSQASDAPNSSVVYPVVPDRYLDNLTVCSSSTFDDCETLPAGPGRPNADVLLLVSNVAEGCGACTGGGTSAWAAACVRDTYDRPVLGAINVCPNNLLDAACNHTRQTQVDVVTHELLHACAASPPTVRRRGSHLPLLAPAGLPTLN